MPPNHDSGRFGGGSCARSTRTRCWRTCSRLRCCDAGRGHGTILPGKSASAPAAGAGVVVGRPENGGRVTEVQGAGALPQAGASPGWLPGRILAEGDDSLGGRGAGSPGPGQRLAAAVRNLGVHIDMSFNDFGNVVDKGCLAMATQETTLLRRLLT